METQKQQQQHEFGYIEGDKVFLRKFLDFPNRQIGVVKESEEASLLYFENRFEIAHQKVMALDGLIEEAQNKGSYLMKLVHMRKYLSNFDGLGDYVYLFAKLDELEKKLRAMIAINRVKNLEIKEALLKEAEEIIESPDIIEREEEIKEVKQKWIKTGAVIKEKQDELENKFQELYGSYFGKRKEIIRQRNNQARNNLRKYQQILEQVERIKYSDDFDATFQEFRNLQQAWKTAGKVPHKQAIILWDNFKKANDYFFTRFKNYKALKSEYPALTANQIKEKLQVELSQEADKLSRQDAHLHTERAKELLMDWKKITSVFKGIDRECGNVFRFACDRIFEESYLMRVVKRKYPLFETKPQEDQFRIRISFMRELIRRDEEEVSISEDKYQRSQKRATHPKVLRTMLTNLNIQKRKIEVKKEVLKELQNELNTLRK